MIPDGAQDFIAAVGAEGCYALTRCKIAEIVTGAEWTDTGTAVLGVERGVKAGYIKPDMTVLDGAAFLKMLTGKAWTMFYVVAKDYKPKEGDWLAAEWFNPKTGKTHFTLESPVKWNSLGNSVTVKEGAIRSYRVYRVKGA